jgi:ribosomal protein S4E
MIKLKKITPMFNGIITTADVYEQDSVSAAGIIDGKTKKGALKEYQTVISIGSSVRACKVGDMICVNPKRYEVRKYGKDSTKEAMVENYNTVVSYNFNFIEINDELCLQLYDDDIKYVVDEFEEVDDPVMEPPKEKSNLILPPTNLILP